MKTLGYLCGGPRVSTRPDAENAAARNHVIGVIDGFEQHGWSVKTYIVGDRVHQKCSSSGSGGLASRTVFHRLAADIIRLVLRVFNQFRALRELGQDVDVVYERFTCMQAVGRPFQRQGIPWILECNALFYDEATSEGKTVQLKSVAKYFERKAYQQCDLLVCISGSLKQALISKMGVEADKIIVVPNGVNLSRFSGAVERRYPHGEFVVGFTGLLTKWNRLLLLLKAIAALKEEGLRISLALVGDGDEKADLQAELNELGISDQVRFEGRVAPTEVVKYIKSFDLGYCNPLHQSTSSDFSGCPMKLFEYMAAGCNLLVSKLETVAEVGLNDEVAFLFEGDDLSSLTEALRRAYHERESFKSRSESLELIASQHSWENRVDDIIEGAVSRGILQNE